MQSNYTRILSAAGAAILLVLGAHLRAVDELFPCDLQHPQNKVGCTALSATDLAEEIRGAGITSITNVTYSGAAVSAGKLLGGTGAANIIGLDSGVVLSTGNIATVVGPNTSPSAGTNLKAAGFSNGAGDADLSTLSGFTTFDATVLEFDFVPDKSTVFVQYVFASEEYNAFVNRKVGGKLFNDVFAFFVNGVNCATIGGEPVSIQTINGGGPALGTPPISHSELYLNNDFQPVAPRNTQMDGLTKVLTCRAAVNPNVTNHIKLAIADASDANQDSIVVLRSASFTTTPPLTIVKKTNATNNDDAATPNIAVGDPVQWSYVVTNSGFDTLTEVAVTDDKLGAISCPRTTLTVQPDPGSTMTCLAGGTAGTGDYSNVGTVVGTSPIIGAIEDSNPDKYFGAQPAIKIVTKTDYTDNDAAPGPFVHVGEPVTWTYEVTNTGNVTLNNVAVSDNKGATVSCAILPGGPPKTTLSPGEMMVCLASGPALAGQFENLGTAEGSIDALNVDGSTKTVTVSSSNADHYFGADPKVGIVKKTDGTDNNSPPGIYVATGDALRWTFDVTNTGNVPLANIRVEDPAGVTICTIASLDVGATNSTCALDGVAAKGQQKNTGKAIASYTVVAADGSQKDVPVLASDDEYYVGADPKVALVKKVDGSDHNTPPGAVVLAGDPIRWSYEATNTGNVPLTNVRIEDPASVAICTIPALAVGETNATCVLDATALKGQQKNTGYATATFTVVKADGTTKDLPVQASDDEYYIGVDPRVAIVKKVDGSDHNSAPGAIVLAGDPIRWTFDVTNTGNVALTNIRVEDPAGTAVCTISNLAVAEINSTCAVDGTAQKGQQKNTGYAAGTFTVVTADGTTKDVPVQASDDEYYLGADPHVAIVKKVDGSDHNTAPGAIVQAGAPIRWTYEVTNTGNVTLTNVAVQDPANVTVCTIASLAAAESSTCTLDGVALKGQQKNTGYAVSQLTVVTPDGTTKDAPVQASDDEYYLGIDPHIAVIKKTNGIDSDKAPGPTILTGSHVTWTYAVTNTGNVALADVGLVDDKEGPICSVASLAVGQTINCAKDGTAGTGAYSNTATASGSVEVLQITGQTGPVAISAVHANYYFGANPRLAIVKKTVTFKCVPSRDESGHSHGDDGDDDHDTGDDGHDSHGLNNGLGWLGGEWSFGSKSDGWHKEGDDDDHEHAHGAKDCGHAGDHEHERAGDNDHGDHGHHGGEHDHKDNGYGSWTDQKQYGFGGSGDYHGGHDGHGDDDKYDDHDEHGDRDEHRGSHGGSFVLIRTESDNNIAPGPFVKAGAKIGWTYTVTNTGNVPLANVVVTDDHEGAICTIPLLAVGQTAPPCSKDGVAKPGQYENVGTATSSFGPVLVNDVSTSVPVTASDLDHYFGGSASIAIVKTTNGSKHGTAPGATIVAGSPVTWTYVISNTGNVPLTGVTLVDDRIGPIACPSTTLAAAPDPGSVMTCSASGVAIAGQYSNMGTVTAMSPFGSVTASDCEYYFGVKKKKHGHNGHEYEDDDHKDREHQDKGENNGLRNGRW